MNSCPSPRALCGSLRPLAAPCAAAALSLVLVLVLWQSEFPGALSLDSLARSVAGWRNTLASVGRLQTLCVMLAVHAVQLLLCFPLPNITRTMYGYIFGAVPGLLISSCWESALTVVFLFVFSHCRGREPRVLESLVVRAEALHSSTFFNAYLALVQLSSLPMAVKAAVALSPAVGAVRFVALAAACALAASARDATLGHAIAQSRSSAADSQFYAFVIIFNALIPTCISVWVLLDASRAGGAQPAGASSGEPCDDPEDRPAAPASVPGQSQPHAVAQERLLAPALQPPVLLHPPCPQSVPSPPAAPSPLATPRRAPWPPPVEISDYTPAPRFAPRLAPAPGAAPPRPPRRERVDFRPVVAGLHGLPGLSGAHLV